MKILLAFCVTSNLMGDFSRSNLIQSSFRDTFRRFDKVLITDKPTSRCFVRSWPVVQCNPWVNGEFCLAKMRNAALWWARATDAEWIVLLDADSVIVNFPTVFPETGLGRLQIYCEGHDEESFDLKNSARWTESWWFMVHNRHLKRRFDEGYVGYGWEERDFQDVIMRDVPESYTDLRAIHAWHPPRFSKNENYSRFESRLNVAGKADVSLTLLAPEGLKVGAGHENKNETKKA
jgi:hypothetical protein